jgi:hypothetical protein
VTIASDISRRQTAGRLRRLGFGFGLAASVLVLYQFVSFLLHTDSYPRLPYSIAAWALLIAGMVIVYVTNNRRASQLPAWALPTVISMWAATTTLDLIGCWARGSSAAAPAAAMAVGAGLLQVVTHAQARTIAVAASLLGAAIAIAFALHGLDNPQQLALAYLMIGIAVAPSILAVFFVRSLGIAAQLELDRAQVQSTVSSPGFTLGMLASEELARLDLDAERLLDEVATGRAALPLRPETASVAASLATELRLHLIEGRRETWLHHAVSESAFLGPAVTVSDSDGLAGLLDSEQRDGLLAAVWLLLSDPPRPGQRVNIVVSARERQLPHSSHASVRVPISISATGVPRRGVDPATWQAIRKVGRYEESIRDSVLLIEIECEVDNPADYESEPLAPNVNTTKGSP